MATSVRVADELAGCVDYYEDPKHSLEGMAGHCRISTRNDVAQMQRLRPDWWQTTPRF